MLDRTPMATGDDYSTLYWKALYKNENKIKPFAYYNYDRDLKRHPRTFWKNQ